MNDIFLKNILIENKCIELKRSFYFPDLNLYLHKGDVQSIERLIFTLSRLSFNQHFNKSKKIKIAILCLSILEKN